MTCRILPPPVLHIPVLPLRFNGKLIFTLCFTCMSTSNKKHCKHDDEDRAIRGTWGIPEVQLALSQGYKILRYK